MGFCGAESVKKRLCGVCGAPLYKHWERSKSAGWAWLKAITDDDGRRL